MMFWLIVAAVAVVLFALAWWSSGRSRGLRRPLRDRYAIDNDEQAMQQMQPHRMGPPMSGPGGPGSF